MRILLIGGTGFIGSFLAPELQRRGAEVATLTRGRSPIAHADGLTRIIGDRKRLRDALSSIRAFAPDVVVDLVLSSGTQARELMSVLQGITSRVVAISSIDVYRACGILHGLEEGPPEPVPLTEDSPLRTKLATYPPAQIAALQQIFGWLDDEYDKIPVEQAVLGHPSLPGTVLRLPMIYGPGDLLHRLWPLVKRMDDRRAAILMDARVAAWRSPRGYVENVAAAIALAAMSGRAANRVYNVAEPESYSEIEWARRVAKVVGLDGGRRRAGAGPDPAAPASARQLPAGLERRLHAHPRRAGIQRAGGGRRSDSADSGVGAVAPAGRSHDAHRLRRRGRRDRRRADA
jgi:nucleoside-diphosphate-sugar epimerase